MKNKKETVLIVSMCSIGCVVAGLCKAISVRCRLRELEEERKEKELKEKLKKEEEERELKEVELAMAKNLIDDVLLTLMKPYMFSSSETLSKINADDRAMVYAELVKQYDKILLCETVESVNNQVNKYENLFASVDTEEKCKVYVAMLKQQKKQQEVIDKRKHEERLEDIKVSAEVKKAELAKETEIEKMQLENEREEIISKRERDIVKSKASAATDIVDTLAIFGHHNKD